MNIVGLMQWCGGFLKSAALASIANVVGGTIVRLGGEEIDYYYIRRETQFLVDHPGRRDKKFFSYWVTDRENGCKKDAAYRKEVREQMIKEILAQQAAMEQGLVGGQNNA